jgi:uncharacterized membrane protein
MKSLPIVRWWGSQVLWATQFVGVGIGQALLNLKYYRYKRIVYALIITNAASVLLFLLRLIGSDSFRYWFMLWNLALAWTAPFIAWLLIERLKRASWRHWSNIALTVLWIGFLPNSFYMVSDLIHVRPTGEVSIIFDAVLFSSFIFNGFVAGYIGSYFVHRELIRRRGEMKAYAMIIGVFALASYAIYLGRVLRWNTWDAIFHPAGLIFDVSDNILNPLAHPQAFVVTLSFTLLITVFYLFAYEVLRVLKLTRR